MFPKHEHWLTSFTIELLEEDERFLFEPQAAFLVAVDNVKRVLPPVGLYVILFQCSGEDFMAWVFHADPEGFEYFHLRITAGGA